LAPAATVAVVTSNTGNLDKCSSPERGGGYKANSEVNLASSPGPHVCLAAVTLCCAGSVAPFLDDKLLESVAQHLLSKLQGGGLKPDAARTYVQGLAAISRAVGYRWASGDSDGWEE
jgi:hypothetical protein